MHCEIPADLYDCIKVYFVLFCSTFCTIITELTALHLIGQIVQDIDIGNIPISIFRPFTCIALTRLLQKTLDLFRKHKCKYYLYSFLQ